MGREGWGNILELFLETTVPANSPRECVLITTEVVI